MDKTALIIRCFALALLALHSYEQQLSNSSKISEEVLSAEEEYYQWLVKCCPYVHNWRARPVSSQRDRVPVSIRFSVKRLLKLDNLDQKLSIQGWFDITWPLLPCSKCKKMISSLSEEASMVGYAMVAKGEMWHPRILLANEYGDGNTIEEAAEQITVVPYGEELLANIAAVGTFESMCTFDYKVFPFDTQRCFYELFLATPEMKGLVYVANDSEIRFASKLGNEIFSDTPFIAESDIWSLQDYSTEIVRQSGGLVVHFIFQFERKPQYYIVSMFIPILIVMVLQIATLLMPPEMPDRAAFSMTVTLAFSVLQTIFFADIPKTAQTVYLFYYVEGSMASGAAITLYALFTSTWAADKATENDNKKKGPGGLKRISLVRLVDIVVAIAFVLLVTTMSVIYFALCMTQSASKIRKYS